MQRSGAPGCTIKRAVPATGPPSRRSQGMLGIEGMLAGSFDVMPLVALLTAHEAMMSVACCATYPCSMEVALDSGRLVLPAKVAAAVDITPGLLRADGPALAPPGS